MDRATQPRQRPSIRVLTAALLLVALFGPGKVGGLHAGLSTIRGVTSAYADGGCQLNAPGGTIQHVVSVQFDNLHLTRDNPNVPSDLEQMPHLLNFMKSNGVLFSHHYTPLISHTATDILSSLTGLYGDRTGVPVSNSFRYFNPDGSSNLGVSFAYWTDPIFDPTTATATDTQYNMLTAPGTNTPAPWVPYTRAGCNVGAVSTANIVLENIGTDIPTVFGAGSPQAAEVKSDPNQAFADFVGIGIHCAQGNALCSTANGGAPDVLPTEPGGYTGYSGLFGHKYVAPQISPSGPLTDLNGNVIQDPKGHVGFPGFDGMPAAVSLSYVAAMQEHGVPVTYAYISDAHDKHPSGPAYGPGEAGYVAALKSYDTAFGAFFDRLNKDGITPSNTLFVFTSDENDHFAGGGPTPAGCDGVNTPCTYSKIGEVNANLAGLLATEQGVKTTFKVHSDSAPTFYVDGNPAPGSDKARTLERAVGALTAQNPISGNTEQITNYLADPVEEKILHMVTADPMRTPTFTQFAKPDYFLFAGAPDCSKPCVTENPAFAWNHGDLSPDIVTTWLGMVGPGVQPLGLESATWSDHTDIRPTMMALLGLKDDYTHDGRVIFEALTDAALPAPVRADRDAALRLAQTYKQIDASVGQFAQETLAVSTAALESSAAGDSVYTQLEQQLQTLSTQRDALAAQMIAMLNGAEFNGQPIDDRAARSLADQGQALLAKVYASGIPLAAAPDAPGHGPLVPHHEVGS